MMFTVYTSKGIFNVLRQLLWGIGIVCEPRYWFVQVIAISYRSSSKFKL